MKEKCADCEMRKDMAEIKTKCRLLMLGEADIKEQIRAIYGLAMKHAHGHENEKQDNG